MSAVLSFLNDIRARVEAECRGRSEANDLKGEEALSNAVNGLDEAIADIPASNVEEVLLKARLGRRYVERTDGPPDDTAGRFLLRIAEDLERLAGGAPGV
jgi:hypothetical protein